MTGYQDTGSFCHLLEISDAGLPCIFLPEVLHSPCHRQMILEYTAEQLAFHEPKNGVGNLTENETQKSKNVFLFPRYKIIYEEDVKSFCPYF